MQTRTTATPPQPPAALGWRLLAMLYDTLPVLALWFAIGALSLLLRAGQPIVPWSVAFHLQALALYAVTGVYFIVSWRRGGQTLGMRAWRLQLLNEDVDATPGLRELVVRYLAASLSLALLGGGFLVALFDPRRRTLHDRLSRTRLVRVARRSA